MAEGLQTLDGDPVAIDQAEAAFAAAMAAPAPDRPGMAAPVRKPPEPAADPDAAPHGWTWTDGQWRPKKQAGRPRGAEKDRPRVQDAPKSATRDTAKAPPRTSPPSSAAAAKPVDFTPMLHDVAEAVWFGLASAPIPDVAFGYKLTGLRTRIRVQAAIIEQNAEALVGGVNLMAQHNRFVKRACERMATGEGGLWVLPAATMLAPFIAATGQLWSGRLADEQQLEQTAAATEAAAQAYIQQLFTAAAPEPAPAE